MEDILNKITKETIVITPNQRLSATLHRLYQQHQLDQEIKCWQTPDFLPFNAWQERLWLEDALPNKRLFLLNTIQEQMLWEKVIGKTDVLQLTETASTALSAWKLIKQWQIDLNHPSFSETEDYQFFKQWITSFQLLCDQHQWIDHALLVDYLSDAIMNRMITVPKHILLLGFTELPPQWQTFFECCKQSGSQVESIHLLSQHLNTVRLCLEDAEDEVVTMARWAKKIITNHPSSKIGCVVPMLDKKRDRVMQLFSDVFSEQTMFNVSAGKHLSNYPIIHAALEALSFYKNTIPVNTFRYFLTSPFIGDAENEYIKRASYDQFLRKKNVLRVDFNLLKNSLESYSPKLSKRIFDFKKFFTDNNQTRSYYEWAEIFNNLLTLLGWPGERSLNSEEYQIVQAWLHLLTQLQSLDQISGTVPYHQALRHLITMANKNIFQAQTPEAPIQVLGTLEAAGLPFDYLWVSGLDHLSWPPPSHPNPFIPKSLQRQFNMPHATAERELIYCENLIEQYKQSASHVIFSHAAKQDDLILQVSTLIESISEIQITDLALPIYQTSHESSYLSQQKEFLLDELAPPIVLHDETIKGGVNVIKQQALCPFKAFSEWRLHAHAMDEELPGLRAKDRGILIHKALELIWNTLQDQASLLRLSQNELDDLIRDCIQQAFLPFQSDYAHRPVYLQLEQTRLQLLINQWLNIEKNRPPFKVIKHENKIKLKLNQFQFDVRIDRIDELSSQNQLIIDYKTSRYHHINQWMDDRPEEPQLPLYALHYPNNTIGIAFAHVTKGECRFNGISHDIVEINGIKVIDEVRNLSSTTWTQQLNAWKNIFIQLCEDFTQGVAKVNPKDTVQTCGQCSLHSLCRIREEFDVKSH